MPPRCCLGVASLAPLTIATAQQTWKQLPAQEIYVRPYEPFRVVANLYYVGTYDLGVYLGTLERQKKLQPDIWVASHAPQFNLYQKHKAGDAYQPNRFVDPDGYGAKIQFYEKLFRAALDRDRAANRKQ